LEKQSRREKQKSGEAGKQRGTTVEKQRSEEAKKQKSGEANKQRTMKAKAPGKTQQIVVAITDARGTLNPLGKMPQKTCATAPPGKKLYMHISLAPTLFFCRASHPVVPQMSFKGLWVVFILASIQMCIVQKGEVHGP